MCSWQTHDFQNLNYTEKIKLVFLVFSNSILNSNKCIFSLKILIGLLKFKR